VVIRTTIQDIITKRIAAENEARKTRVRSGKFNPSSFGRCYRAQIYNRLNVPETNPTDITSLRKFKCGNLFHEFVQSHLPEKTVEQVVETQDVYCRADIVGDDTVYDIKSQHSRAFWYMQKDGYDIAHEKHDNWLQVMYAAVELKKKYGCLIFVSKDDLCMAEYVDETDNWVEEVNTELITLRGYWDRKELPPAVARCYGGKECEYCKWKTLCQSGGMVDGLR